MENGFFQKMCKEAEDDLASGEKGWRDADGNTLLLACFGMLSNQLMHSITRPLWWFVGVVATGVAGYLITILFGG